MAPFKDLIRIVNGISLVAQEAAKRSEALAAARSGDLETLVSKTLKKALVSATDLAGFTKGEPRQISSPRPGESSVVYFFDPPQPQPEPAAVPRSEPTVSSVLIGEEDGGGKGNVVEEMADVKVLGNEELGDSSTTENKEKDVNLVVNSTVASDGSVGGGNEQVVEVQVPLKVKKRRPRERRVPSTPFTRALG